MTLYSPKQAPKTQAGTRLSAVEKSAVVVAHLHPDQAAAVLRGLRAADLRRFSEALQRVRNLPDAAVRQVVQDFLAALDKDTSANTAIRSMLGDVLDHQALDQLMLDVGVPRMNLWAFMAKMSADEMQHLLADEHPQTIAWVMGKLAPDHARQVLPLFPQRLAQQVVLAMTSGGQVAESTAQVIETTLTRRLLGGS